MKLSQFSKELKEVSTKYGRPFICEESPLECNVFIVGINPVTKTSFWNHWDEEVGFNKKEWYKAYLNDRNNKPTLTRKRVDWFFDDFRDSDEIELLETNLYQFSSLRASGLSNENKNSLAFNFLLKTIKPKAIIAHGKVIRRYVWHLSGCSFDKIDQWTKEREIFNFKSRIYGCNHLAYQLSDEKCIERIKKLKNDLVRFLN